MEWVSSRSGRFPIFEGLRGEARCLLMGGYNGGSFCVWVTEVPSNSQFLLFFVPVYFEKRREEEGTYNE